MAEPGDEPHPTVPSPDTETDNRDDASGLPTREGLEDGPESRRDQSQEPKADLRELSSSDDGGPSDEVDGEVLGIDETDAESAAPDGQHSSGTVEPNPAPPDGAGEARTASPGAARVRSFRSRRSWPQRLLLVFNVLLVLVCFVTASVLVLGRNIANSIARVDIPATTPNRPAVPSQPISQTSTGAAATGTTTLSGDNVAPTAPAPTDTFPVADPQAQNFLITGADNDACVDPNSPYAGAFGDRSAMGERSDTILVMRVDPSTNRAAMLSFPRDLYVKVPGRGKTRINAAYSKDNPATLIKTLDDNFDVKIDHYIQIDFCAFKTIIDHIPNGIGIPFDMPARDTHTGLNVPDPGCAYLDGEAALAYVRSRHYEYFKDGRWRSEGLSDIARIARQQDFIRRVIQTALDKGLLTPSILSGLIEVLTHNVTVDSQLTASSMLSFAGVLRNVQAAGIPSYQIEWTSKTVNGAAVLIPNLTSKNMQAILQIFWGQASLAAAPVQTAPATVPDTAAAGSATTNSTSTAPPATASPSMTAPAETDPKDNTQGIVPPRDRVCP